MAKRFDNHAASEDVAASSALSASPQELVTALRTQIEGFLDYATDAALQPLLGSNLPFVGDALGDLLSNTLLAPLREAIDTALDGIDTAAASIPKAIAKAINAADIPGVSAKVVDGNVSITLQSTDTASADTGKVDLDVGYDALGFEVKGGLSADLGYKLDAELMFDVDSGRLSVIDKEGDVIQLSLKAEMDKLNGKGALGFLNVDVTDANDDPEIELVAGVDIDGGRVNQLDASDLHMTVDGTARIDLGLVASLDGSEPGEASPLPRIFTNLETVYRFEGFNPAGDVSILDTVPTVALRDIQLDVGTLVEWLGDVLEPVTDRIFGAYALDELLSTLTAPIPLIDGGVKAIGLFDLFNIIDDNRINLLDLAGAASPEARPIIEAFSKAYNLIKGLGGLDDSLGNGERINFGDKVLLGDAPANADALAAKDYMDKLRDVLSGIDTPGTNGLDNDGGSLADLLDGTGFEIPLLENPSAIVGILLNGLGGKPIDLVRYDVPELAFDAGFSQFFPIVGPIGVGLNGQFGAGIDIKVGYDTSGLQSGNLEEGFFITTDKLNKPYFVAGPGSSKVFYESAGWVEAGIGASAGINIGIAEVSVGGGVFAGLDTYFEGATEEGNGKLRLSDLSGCMFDPIVGEFGVKVQVSFSIGIGPFSYTKRFDIVKETLANFEFGCTPETQADHGLAHYSSPFQRLTLNAGDRAEDRIIQGKIVEDGDETYVLKQAANGAIKVQAFGIAEINGHPNGLETADDGGKVTQIVAHMGAGDDQVAIDKAVTAGAQLWGDEGNDLLQGGAGADILRGEDEDDRLIGQDGADKLEGGDGDDVLEGGAGGDIIDGGDGMDQVTYENSKVGVVFRQSTTDDEVFVGSGGDATGDRVTGVEHVIGSHFADKLYGNPDESSTLEGLDGADVLVGGDEDDLLLGGGGADNLYGGDGDDTMSFLTSAGQVIVDLQTGEGKIGDAEGDHYHSIENVHGTAYDDMITGNGSDNKISGWVGDDTIYGGGGADEIDGGEGDDIVFGSADGGVLSGGGWLNAAGRDTLSYLTVGHGVDADLLVEDGGDDDITRAVVAQVNGTIFVDPNYSTFENLVGSLYADTLRGDWQANTIKGASGDDDIDGSKGDDVLIGGQGADDLLGGAGRDLADYSDSNAGVSVFLNGLMSFGGDAEGDTLSSVEDLRGTRFVDTLVGDDGDNRLEPGLASSFNTADTVLGGGGTDTLVVNYGLRDTGRGMSGGFDAGSSLKGSFLRMESNGSALLDRVNFDGIERLEVTGTAEADLIYAGAGDDIVRTGDGADTIYTGSGVDRIDAGNGNDAVAVGTDANRQLAGMANANFGDIRGGAGIDTLSLSLSDATSNVVLAGKDGKTEFAGINYTNNTGSAISGFEVLGAVNTGRGDDRLTQVGRFDNLFDTGFGVDVIAAGQGKDAVFGGQDFRIGTEVTIGATTNGRTELELVGGPAKVLANSGDLLQLDYSAAAQGMTSSVKQANTGFFIEQDGTTLDIFTNVGSYSAGQDQTSFHGIERVAIAGSAFADQIFGTNLTYGANLNLGGARPNASLSKRGDDVLNGNAGNDTIVGGTGDDLIDGGAGNDLIFGTAAVLGRALPTSDRGEIDTLKGGAGRDVFVLGNSVYSYYDDRSDLGGGNSAASTLNRAVITDFVIGQDKLVLSSGGAAVPSSLYVAVEKNGNTLIYMADGRGPSGEPLSSANELIAELKGVTGLNLNAHYVVYDATATNTPWLYGDGSVAPAPYPAGTPAPVSAISPDAAAAQAPAEALADIMDHPVDAPLEAPKPSWIKQTSDVEELDEALWGGDDAPFTSWNLEIEGNGLSFGTFDGDPFGLGKGVILSTGKAADLAGTNLVDGGRVPEQLKDLVFEDIGEVTTAGGGNARIFRADLSKLGFDINSLKLGDSGSGFGGSPGVASGFDIDAVVLSRTKVDSFADAAQFNMLKRIDAFSFNVADTRFEAGTMRPDGVQGPNLTGTVNGLPNFGAATLNMLDSPGFVNAGGMLTLGDGGSLGLNLKNEVSTDGPLYLYIAEVGANDEEITSGFTAQAGRLDSPADLSTDLGAPGAEDDTAALVYTFNGRQTDTTTTKVSFDFVFFSEEFAEFAQSEFNDKFRITLNGVNLTQTSTGAFGSVSTIYTPPAGPEAQSSIYGFYSKPVGSDYVGNPADGGPLADKVRADGYTKTITFTGDIKPGEENVLRIEVMDTGDGLLDSGLLVSGKMITDTEGTFVIDRDGGPLRENQWRELDYRIDLPEDAVLDGNVTVTFRPEAHVDLGAGAGVAVTETLTPADLTGVISARVIEDGQRNTSRTDLIQIELGGAMAGEEVPPLALEVVDRLGPVAMGNFEVLDPGVFGDGGIDPGWRFDVSTPFALTLRSDLP